RVCRSHRGIGCVSRCSCVFWGRAFFVTSIDSLAPARSPFGLRPCRWFSNDSVPAGDNLLRVNDHEWTARRKLFPPRFFGYTFLGNAKKVFVCLWSSNVR